MKRIEHRTSNIERPTLNRAATYWNYRSGLKFSNVFSTVSPQPSSLCVLARLRFCINARNHPKTQYSVFGIRSSFRFRISAFGFPHFPRSSRGNEVLIFDPRLPPSSGGQIFEPPHVGFYHRSGSSRRQEAHLSFGRWKFNVGCSTFASGNALAIHDHKSLIKHHAEQFLPS